MTVLVPADEAELAAMVADAAAKKTRLAIVGGGTRNGLGRPTGIARPAAILSALTGILPRATEEQWPSIRKAKQTDGFLRMIFA